MLRASALQRWAMSTGRRLVSRPAPNVTAPDCVIVQDCDKLVGILMLSSLAVLILLAAIVQLVRCIVSNARRRRSGYRNTVAALAELAEMTAPESPLSPSQPPDFSSSRDHAMPNLPPRLEQVRPSLLETLVLSRKQGPDSPPSPPPSPPTSSNAEPDTPGTEPPTPAVETEEASGNVARPKTFIQKFRELGYAPRDLYLIYSIKFAESTAYFAFSYIYAPYLSKEFGMSDVDAGILYALYGVLCSVFGLIAGPAIDSLSLRSALLLGTIPSFIARFGSAVTQDVDFVAFCSVSLLPLGAAFGLPVFALGVRRFTHPENRAFAFTIFYAVLCASSAAGGFVISFARSHFHHGLWLPWPLSRHISWMRCNVLLSSFFTLYTVAASCTIRNVRVNQKAPLESAQLESLLALRPRASRSWAERKRVAKNYVNTVYGDAAFWRLLVISLIVALGTRATFRHLDATFPKYFMRTFGEDAPFEIFVAIEPVITVLLSFPATFFLLRSRASTYRSLVGGTLLQSFCPVALMWTSYGNTLAFVVIMALGEAIWSPRLYEYSTMVAPEGFEGTFVAVAFVPQYVSAGVVGVTSGYLLDRYVPETLLPGELRRPELLWGFVATASFVTPLCLVLLKRRLFVDEPTLQTDTQSVAVRRGPRSNARAHGAYAMALDDSAREVSEVELADGTEIVDGTQPNPRPYIE